MRTVFMISFLKGVLFRKNKWIELWGWGGKECCDVLEGDGEICGDLLASDLKSGDDCEFVWLFAHRLKGDRVHENVQKTLSRQDRPAVDAHLHDGRERAFFDSVFFVLPQQPLHPSLHQYARIVAVRCGCGGCCCCCCCC